MGSFEYEGHRLHYDEYGSGDRLLVLTHGLLMNGRMHARLGPEIAGRGYRVICLDLLGHGHSDAPGDLREYSMTGFGEQVAGLLDHLEVEAAVVGGTSLGANVSLEFAVAHPDRTRGLVIEMPVLDNALLAVALLFTPVLFTLRFGRLPAKAVAAVTRRIPRSHYLVDVGLDWARRDPDVSLAVLEGLMLGRTCPPRDERERIAAPLLAIGHPSDPLHPFSDADMLVDEVRDGRLVDADSILEWRLNPGRLNDELASFLEEVWGESEASGPHARVRAA